MEAPAPSVTFPVEPRRALTTLAVFFVLGLIGAVGAILNVVLTDAEAKQPLALLVLVLGIPAIWVVTVLCLATFSLRVTGETVEKLLAGRWVVASRPLRALRSAAVAQSTLVLTFEGHATIRLAAMPLRDRARLERVLAERCPGVPLT